MSKGDSVTLARPVSVRKASTDRFREYGRSGLDQSAGYVLDEYITDLRGSRGAKRYREMADTSPLSGILARIVLSYRNVTFRVVPFEGGDSDDVARAKRIECALHDMERSWHETQTEIWTMLTYGYAPMEHVWKVCRGYNSNALKSSRYDDGVVSWAAMSLRSQESLDHWVFDESQRATAFVQCPPPTYTQIEIPLEKLYLFRTQSVRNNPEGRSIMRGVYWNWYVWKKLTEIAAIQSERDGVGIPIAYVDAKVMAKANDGDSAASAIVSEFRKLVENLRWDDQSGLLVPAAWDEGGNRLYEVSLMPSPGTKQVNILEQIKHQEMLMALGLVQDSALMGHEQIGTYSLASNKTSIEAKALAAYLEAMCDVFNRQAIPDFFRMNGWPMDRLCNLEHGDFETQDLNELASFLEKITNTGMPLWPNRQLEDHILDVAGLPKPTDEERDDAMGMPAVPDNPAAPPVEPEEPEEKPNAKPNEGEMPDEAEE